MLEGGGNKRETDKQVAQELPSCHHQSLAGQWAVAEIILQIILLLTVRDVWNQGQEYSKCVCVFGEGGRSLLKTCQMPRDLISVSFSQWATAQ